jgi:hypothetical protein
VAEPTGKAEGHRHSRPTPLRPVTLLLAFGYMFHTFTFYYILKFAPTDRGGLSGDIPRPRKDPR